MADKFRDDKTTPVCSDWLNNVDWAVFDALGLPRTPAAARVNIGALGEAPTDGSTYVRQNGAWVPFTDPGGDPVGDAIVRVPTGANINKITVSGNPTYVPLEIEMDATQSADGFVLSKVGEGDPLIRMTKSGGLVVGPYSALDGTPGSARAAFTATENAVGVTTQRNSAVASQGLLRVNVGNGVGAQLGIVIKTDDSPSAAAPVFEVLNAAEEDLMQILGDGTIRAGLNVFTTGQAIVAPGTNARLTCSRVALNSTNQLLLESEIVSGAGRRTLRYYPARQDLANPDEPVLMAEFNPGYSGSSLWTAWELRTKIGASGWNGDLRLSHGKMTSGSSALFGNWSIRPGEFAAEQAVHFIHQSRIPDGSTSGEALSCKMYSDGDFSAEKDIYYKGSILDISDAAVKDNIRAVTSSGLSMLERLEVKEYDNTLTGQHEVGVVAQECRKVAPEFVAQRKDGMLGVSYVSMIPWLVKAVQELKREIGA